MDNIIRHIVDIDKRASGIMDRTRKEIDEKEKETKENIEKMKSDIIDRAKDEADSLYKSIVDEAKSEAESIVRESMDETERLDRRYLDIKDDLEEEILKIILKDVGDRHE